MIAGQLSLEAIAAPDPDEDGLADLAAAVVEAEGAEDLELSGRFPADMSDLDINGEEERLRQVDAERAQRIAPGLKADPMPPRKAPRCQCPQPWLQEDELGEASCARCGKAAR